MEDLIQAFEEYQDARNDLKEKSKKCEYDRSYFLSEEIERVGKAKKELSFLFKKAVLSIINEELTIKTK